MTSVHKRPLQNDNSVIENFVKEYFKVVHSCHMTN